MASAKQSERSAGPLCLVLMPIFCLLALQCGSNVPAHEHPEPLSAEEHEQHAVEHEKEAALTSEQAESKTGEPVECVDMGPPIESGGERIKLMRPCWTRAEQSAAYKRAAAGQRKAAREHRAWAQLLRDAEAEACSSLAPRDRETGPFVRTADILSVDAYRESGSIAGAKVVFRKVPGLSKTWFDASIRCHQARAAKLGYPPEFMPHCPLALEHVSTSVVETDREVAVTLRSKDPEIAAAVYGRALLATEAESNDEESAAQ